MCTGHSPLKMARGILHDDHTSKSSTSSASTTCAPDLRETVRIGLTRGAVPAELTLASSPAALRWMSCHLASSLTLRGGGTLAAPITIAYCATLASPDWKSAGLESSNSVSAACKLSQFGGSVAGIATFSPKIVHFALSGASGMNGFTRKSWARLCSLNVGGPWKRTS